MKKYTYSLLAAFAACGLAQAAETAYTTPVGYVTLSIAASSDSTITAPLQRSTVYAGASLSISGDVVGASSLTLNAFVSPACYMKVTSGALAGQFFPITANDASSITVEAGVDTLQSLGFVSGNEFQVIPYWTLNTLFPAGAGVGGTSDALNPTSFVLESSFAGTGTNRAPGKFYFYCTGDAENELPAGWYNNDAVFDGTINDTLIDPSILYTIRSSAAQTAVITGEVPSVKAVTEVAVATTSNDNYMSLPFPVDMSLQESGLQGVVQATADALNPVEFVFTYNDTATGTNKAPSKFYFYCSGDAENELPAGWYDNDAVFDGIVTGKVLTAGRCFIIRKAPYETAGVIEWSSELPYSLTTP